MPLLRYQRYAVSGTPPIYDTYAQELDVFVINGDFVFEFGTGPTWTAGTWVFLTYNSTGVTQSDLDTYTDVLPPTGFTAGAPVLDTANKRVLITLTAI